MRYRLGESPETDQYGSTDEFVLFTVALSLIIGAVLVWLGVKGRQRWLTIWSGGLIVACFAYFGWAFFA